ncbi:hypothetical protein ACTD5D_32190 [Nocardia takedensis]|uniref:hypothetical protein n=1 Tax=Nocardia takedensis TaxID=259390 RepID=UPI003F767B35
MITGRERIAAAAATAEWSPMPRPYATMFHRGGLVLGVDYGPDDEAVAGWWGYTVPGLGQLAFVSAPAGPPAELAITLTAWLTDPAALIETALRIAEATHQAAAADEAAGRLLAVRVALEAFAVHPSGAVIAVRDLGCALLHVIAPEDYPDPAPMPQPRVELSAGGAR